MVKNNKNSDGGDSQDGGGGGSVTSRTTTTTSQTQSTMVVPSTNSKRRPFHMVVRDWTHNIHQKVQPKMTMQSTVSSAAAAAATRLSQSHSHHHHGGGDQELMDMTSGNGGNSSGATNSSSSSLQFIEDVQSMEELERQLMEKVTMEDKCIFVCKNGNDTNSSQLLRRVLEESAQRHGMEVGSSEHVQLIMLGKIVDKATSNCTLMHLCAQRNKVSCMELLHSYKVPIDYTDTISATPLLYAVAHNCEAAAAFLLSKGAKINAKDTYNKFPLLVALRNKHYHMAELLSTFRGIDVHLRGAKGNTCLHMMAEEGDLVAVKLLIEKMNASPQRRNHEEENVLHCCLAHLDIVLYLATRFANNGLSKMVYGVNTYGRNIFHKCANDGHFDGLLVLLGSMSVADFSTEQITTMMNQVDKNGDTPLILAVKNSRKDLIRFLSQCSEVKLNTGDVEDNTALYYAVSMNSDSIITLLKNAGASLKADSKDDDPRRRWTLLERVKSLRTLLMLAFALIATLCILTIAAISLGFFSSSIRKSATDNRIITFNNVISYLSTQVEKHTLSYNTAMAEAKGPHFNVSDSDIVVEFALRSFRANVRSVLPLTIDLYCGNSIGGLAGVMPRSGYSTGYTLFTSYAEPTLRDRYNFTTLENATISNVMVLENKDTIPNDDVFGYLYQSVTGVSVTDTPVWTPSYMSSGAVGFVFITLFQTWRESNGDFIGFCASDISVSSIGDFLYQESRKQGSVIVVVERATGFLIGSSVLNYPLYRQNGKDVERFDGTKEKRLAPMLNYARKKYGGSTLHKVGYKPILDKYTRNGNIYALDMGGYKDGRGIDWVVLQSVDINVFYQELYVSVIIICCCLVGLLVLALIISVISASLFMKPLENLVEQAEAIKMLQLEQVERSLEKGMSVFTEIKSLQNSFYSMSQRLRQFRQFIPDHILAVIETEVIHKAIYIQEQRDAKNGVEPAQADPSNSTSGTSSSLHKLNRGMVSNALTSGLTSGSVSILTVHISNITSLLELYSAADIAETTKDMMNALKEYLKESNGQLVTLNSSGAVIVWNSFISQPDHRYRACKTARNCADAMAKLHITWAHKGLPPLQTHFGVSTGTVYFGNIGSDATKFFTVLGQPVLQSAKLSQLNCTYNTQVLCSEDVEEKVREEFYMRPIRKLDEDGTYIYELGEPKNPDEWVSELTPTTHKWQKFCEAFKLYDKYLFDDAYLMFVSYADQYPEDAVAQMFVEECRSHVLPSDKQPESGSLISQ